MKSQDQLKSVGGGGKITNRMIRVMFAQMTRMRPRGAHCPYAPSGAHQNDENEILALYLPFELEIENGESEIFYASARENENLVSLSNRPPHPKVQDENDPSFLTTMEIQSRPPHPTVQDELFPNLFLWNFLLGSIRPPHPMVQDETDWIPFSNGPSISYQSWPFY
jgi:hypothetical protein